MNYIWLFLTRPMPCDVLMQNVSTLKQIDTMIIKGTWSLSAFAKTNHFVDRKHNGLKDRGENSNKSVRMLRINARLIQKLTVLCELARRMQNHRIIKWLKRPPNLSLKRRASNLCILGRMLYLPVILAWLLNAKIPYELDLNNKRARPNTLQTVCPAPSPSAWTHSRDH